MIFSFYVISLVIKPLRNSMTTILTIIFIIGYFAIAFENSIKINKSASALLTGVLGWMVYIIMGNDKQIGTEQLTEHLAELSGILFFLMGAMTIVELIDAHDGFDVITSRIKRIPDNRSEEHTSELQSLT